ncbi:hypothetical protein TRIUR3_18161 [Triticum urartu]|uniref:Uncharacterized protein n=1 Tax=Triticum urartu TaxID=4572 RepID=M7Z4R2_TRIUA|nr:hypothetical protein TRIUR3_18161 [Triticum urartu]
MEEVNINFSKRMPELAHLIMLATSEPITTSGCSCSPTHNNEVDSVSVFTQLDSLGMAGKIQNQSDWIKVAGRFFFGRFKLVHREGGISQGWGEYFLSSDPTKCPAQVSMGGSYPGIGSCPFPCAPNKPLWIIIKQDVLT